MGLWVGTSWKMNKTLAEATDFAKRLPGGPTRWHVQPFVIPSFTAIAAVRAVLGADSPVLLGAQDAHWEDAGAWTGEVSVPQVKDAGAQIVEIGHSERRAHFGDTDERVALKVRATLRHGLIPLLCVGETEDAFRRGGAVRHVLGQVAAALDGMRDVSEVLVAYEPVWAIGEHGREARPRDIAPVFAALDATWGGRVRGFLYGGSVNAGNAEETLGVPGVGGLFVGRAAWEPTGYLALCDLAASYAQAHPARSAS